MYIIIKKIILLKILDTQQIYESINFTVSKKYKKKI